ncbi:hypothetical protein Tco_0834070 [Tanacetum coccineum]
MDDPNMTMEEYIKLEEEKARRRGRVFNSETATYGKIKVDDDLHNLRSVEAEFPAIVIDNAFAPQNALPCKSQVSTPVNDEIDFRISFDESNDEDYTIISIVYNDAQTSKSDYLTEQTLSPQHNNESDLNNEISLSEYDEVEQNVLYFNDLFHFNVIHPDDLKSDEDNDNNEIDIIQSSEDQYGVSTYMDSYAILTKHLYGVLTILILIRHTALPPREQRHRFLRYEGLQYTEADIEDFEMRLTRIYRREVHRVQVFYFGGFSNLMAEGLSGISSARDFLGIALSYTTIRDTILRLCHRLIAFSIAGRSQAPEEVTITDLFYLRGMDVGSVNVPYLLDRSMLRLIIMGMGVHETREAARCCGWCPWPIVDEGGQADPAPAQAPPPPPPTAAKTMP